MTAMADNKIEYYKVYCPMPFDNFIIVKKSGSQAGIEPTTFGELAICSNQLMG